MSDAVGKAIQRAKYIDELRKQDHYNAKQEYLRRRGLSSHTKETDTAYKLKVSKPGRSSLLLRMAALRRLESPVSSIDDDAVEQYFPEWVEKKHNGWNQEAVLRDIVLAVSQLSHKASLESV